MSEQINEVENKYLIKKKVAFSIIERAIKEGKSDVSFINQIYLFKENSNISYNLEHNCFNVRLKHKEEVMDFDVFVYDKYMKKILNEEFSKISYENLHEEKTTFRVRYLNGVPIFTFKMKVEGLDGNLEFEETLEEATEITEGGFLRLNELLSKMKTRVEKIRYSLTQKSGLVYEIDFYKDEKFITLEVEFKDQETANSFIEDFKFKKNITNDKSMKNKNIAKSKLKK